MTIKFLVPLLGISIGIFLSSEIFPGFALPAFSFGLSFIVWIFAYILSKNPLIAHRISIYHNIWIFLLFLGIGSIDFSLRGESFLQEIPKNNNIICIGEIKDVSYLSQGDRFKIKINSLSDSIGNPVEFKNLELILYTDGYTGSKGDIISFSCNPKRLSSTSKNNILSSKYAFGSNSYYANVKFSEIKKIGENTTLINFFQRLREKTIIRVENSGLERESIDFLIPILLGERTFLDSFTRKTMNSAGLAHIMALSGLHVAIIYGLFLFFLFPLKLAGYHKSQKIIALLLIWLYVFLTGLSPATIRAAIMASFVVLAFLLERKNSALNALLAAMCFILLYNPLYLWDPGLQLSFLCVGSILIFLNKINPIDRHHHPLLFKIMDLILISIITTLSTWVIVAYYFEEIPLLFLPSNLLILPLLPVFIIAGFFYIFFLWIGLDINIIASFLNNFHNILISLAEALSFSGNSVVNIKIPQLSVWFWIFGILLLSFFLYNKKRIKKLVYLSSGFSLLLVSAILMYNQPESINPAIRFQHSFTKIEVLHKNGKDYQTLQFPRKTISQITINKYDILSIDNSILEDSIESLKLNGMHNFIIMGPDADIKQIASLCSTQKPTNIILHSGVGRNKKEELLHLLNEEDWDKVYSLGETGSFDFDL